MRLLLALLFLITAAFAQEQGQRLRCGQGTVSHEEMKGYLGRFKEGPINIGIVSETAEIMEFYASQPGTWTVVIINLVGQRACILLDGINLKSKALKPEQRA